MTIDWWTLTLQTINFLVLVYLLQRFLYKPVRRVIAKRKEAAEKAFDEAKQAESRADSARERFEEQRRQLTQERDRMLKETRAELEAERKEILDKARHEAEETKRIARERLEQERRAAFKALRDKAADLAVEIAGKVLRDSEVRAGADSFLERIAAHLEEMSRDERENLSAQLGDGKALRVVTARALDDAAEERWRERLRHYLGPKTPVAFDANADLIAGAELHFPHAVLRFTWRDALDAAAQELKREEGEHAEPG